MREAQIYIKELKKKLKNYTELGGSYTELSVNWGGLYPPRGGVKMSLMIISLRRLRMKAAL